MRVRSAGPQESSPWFRSAFGELYPLLYPHRSDKAANYEIGRLVDFLGLRDSDRKVLDLACGNGRHMAALQESGLRVYGLDLSLALLEQATGRSGPGGRLVRGDMRYIPFREGFDLVVNLFTSFGYFSDDRENEKVLREMARVLEPGGRLVIDHINTAALQRTLVREDSRFGNGFHMLQRRRIEDRRVKKDITITWDNGEITTLCEDVRLYTDVEMRGLLMSSGFAEVRFFGSTRGEAFNDDSERMIVIAEKPY